MRLPASSNPSTSASPPRMDENVHPRASSQTNQGVNQSTRGPGELHTSLKSSTGVTPSDHSDRDAIIVNTDHNAVEGLVKPSHHTPLARSSSTLSLTESFDHAVDAQDFSETRLNIHATDFQDLALSGRIISAVLCLPHTFTFIHGEDDPWILHHRAGTLALFDSFAFLSSKQSTWKHTLIGWTGEIAQQRSPKIATKLELALDAHPPSSRHSAPFPVDNAPKPVPMDPTLRIDRANRARLEHKLMGRRGIRMVPMWLQDNPRNGGDIALFTDQTKWRHFSEHELYHVLHYRFPRVIDGKVMTTTWEQFVQMNQAFADRVLEHYKPGDIVMVHDYQLMLVPGMLRKRVSDMKICFVLHVPFPSYEYFRVLSHPRELMRGILGADMVVFQSITFIDHFQKTTSKLIPSAQASIYTIELREYPDQRVVALQVLPMGINNEAMQKSMFSDEVDGKLRRLAAQWKDYKVIIGRDRVDGGAGVIQKLKAFSMFLEQYERWRGKVILVQIVSRITIEDKERGALLIEDIIHDLASRINGRFGSFDWKPVRLYNRYVARDEYLALLRVANIGLITSVRDGMNTTSLEFAVAQKYAHGPLLLSEFSGTSTHLIGAVRINPFDGAHTASTIDKALTMDEQDRAEMYERITQPVEEWPVQIWVERALRKLCVHMTVSESAEARPLLDDTVLQSYGRARKRLLIFDYDGTLTPIVESPDDAVPSAEMISSLQALASDDCNSVWIVSGRDKQFLSDHLGHIRGLGMSAEHGCFIKAPDEAEWTNLVDEEKTEWRSIARAAMEATTAMVPGSAVEMKNVAMTWHYRKSDPRAGVANARVLYKKLLEVLGSDHDVEVIRGKANLEVRPKLINKGRVVRRLLATYARANVGGEAEFVLCVGDDRTDEDMFRALRRSDIPMENLFGIVVSSTDKSTLASWRLNDVAAVVDLLGRLADLGGGMTWTL